MLDEVVSFILAAPVDSTSEVLDECAVPSDFLICEITGLPCNENNLLLKTELTFQKQTDKQHSINREFLIFFFSIYPTVQGNSKAGFSITGTESLS